MPQAAAYQLAFNKPKPNKYKIINPQFSMLSDTQVQPVSLVTSHICGLSAALFKTILKTKKVGFRSMGFRSVIVMLVMPNTKYIFSKKITYKYKNKT